MKKTIILTSILGVTMNSFAQADATAPKIWDRKAELGANVALSGTSPNWSGGAANNLAGAAFFNALANAKKNQHSWDNVLKINVGALSQKKTDNAGKDYRDTRKNIDNVFFDSKYGYSFKKLAWLGFFGGLNIQTQLLPGYNFGLDSNGRAVRGKATSSFMSQGVVMPAAGFEAKPQKGFLAASKFFARIGLGAVKNTFVINQKLYENLGVAEIAKVKKGDLIYSEMGFQITAGLNRDFGKEGADKKRPYNVTVNYLGFSPYNFASSNSPLDSRVDLGFSAKLGKYLSLNYTLISIFDKDLRAPGFNAWQNSWILGVGFLTKL